MEELRDKKGTFFFNLRNILKVCGVNEVIYILRTTTYLRGYKEMKCCESLTYCKHLGYTPEETYLDKGYRVKEKPLQVMKQSEKLWNKFKYVL